MYVKSSHHKETVQNTHQDSDAVYHAYSIQKIYVCLKMICRILDFRFLVHFALGKG